MTLAEKRAKRAELFKKLEAQIADIEASKRNIDEAEDADLHAQRSAIEALDSEIVAEERRESHFGAFAALRGRRTAWVAPAVDNTQIAAQRDAAAETLERALARGPRTEVFRDAAGKPDQRAAYTAGRIAMALLAGDRRSIEWCYEHVPEMRAMSSTTNTAGGYLVPDEWSTAIIDLVKEYGVFARSAERWPMSSDTLLIPKVTGGVTAYFVGESTEPTHSAPTFGQVALNAKKLMALVPYPRELAEDAVINIADFLTRKIALAVATLQDQCGFIGDGTSTYGGMRGATVRLLDVDDAGTDSAGAVLAATNNDTWAEYTLADFEGVVAAYPLIAGARPAWHITPQGYWLSIARLQLALSGNTVADSAGGPVQNWMGYPVILNNVMNAAAATADQSGVIVALLADLRLGAAMGVRRELTMRVSEERYAELDQYAIFAGTRFDINCHDCGSASAAGTICGLLAN